MATIQWQFDAPTGTYKQHFLSRRLFEASVEDSVFMEHVQPVSGYGRKQGEQVTLTIVKAVTEPTSGKLTEGQRISEDSYSLATTTITVSEYGRAVPYTSLMEDLSFFDVENSIQKRLKQQMTLVLDTAAATAFQAASIKYAPTGLAANNIATNASFGAQATSNLNMWHVEQIRDYLYDTLFAPPANGGDYIGIFRTLGIRGLKQDPSWEEWHKYTDPQAKYNAEVGRIEGVRFIETNHSNALQKVGSSSVLGEGVVFGADAVAMAEALTPELRAGIPGDFGRSRAVAWYGILEFGAIYTTGNAGEAKIVHVGST